MKIHQIIFAFAILCIAGCASQQIAPGPEPERKWLSRDGFKYSSLLTPSEVDTIVALTRESHPAESYDIRMVSVLGESAIVHMTDAGKLTSFYPYRVIFMKSANTMERGNPTQTWTIFQEVQ